MKRIVLAVAVLVAMVAAGCQPAEACCLGKRMQARRAARACGHAEVHTVTYARAVCATCR